MVPPTGLELQFYHDVEELLSKSRYAWYVTCGFRSRETSDKLYAIYQRGGPRAAPGGKSPHNFGEAVDVVYDRDAIKPGCQMDWNTGNEAWGWLFDEVKKHPRLHSGISFGDAPHIESVKFVKTKLRHKDGTYYMPQLNLQYVLEPTPLA